MLGDGAVRDDLGGGCVAISAVVTRVPGLRRGPWEWLGPSELSDYWDLCYMDALLVLVHGGGVGLSDTCTEVPPSAG